MFFKRDKNNKLSSKAEASFKDYSAMNKKNGNWMNDSGKSNVFNAYDNVSRDNKSNTFQRVNNSAFANELRQTKDSLRNTKESLKKNNDAIKGSIKDSWNTLKQSLVETAKTGKAYDQKRAAKADSSSMSGMMGGEDLSDFMNFEDFDFGDDDEYDSYDDSSYNSDEDEPETLEEIKNKKKKSKSKVLNKNTIINKGGLSESDAYILGQTFATSTQALIRINTIGFSRLAGSFNHIDEVNSSSYSSITSLLSTANRTIQSIIDSKRVVTVSGSRKTAALSDLTKVQFTSLSSLRSTLETTTELFNMAAGMMSGELARIAANPIHELMKVGFKNDKIRNSKVMKKFNQFDTSLKNVPFEMFSKLREDEFTLGNILGERGSKVASKLPFLRDKLDSDMSDSLLGKIFGKNDLFKDLKGLDTKSKLDKGSAVAFDAETHNSINVVITGYLAKLYQTLTGKKIYNDYETGAWYDGEHSENIRKQKTEDFVYQNSTDLKDIISKKFKDNQKDIMNRVIQDKILTTSDLETHKEKYSKEEFEKLRELIEEDNQSFRIAVRKGSLITSSYINNSTLSSSEKNMYNDLFKDQDENVNKTDELYQFRQLAEKLSTMDILVKKRLASLTFVEDSKELEEAEEQKSEAEASLDDEVAEEMSGEAKDKDSKEDKKKKDSEVEDITKESQSEKDKKSNKSANDKDEKAFKDRNDPDGSSLEPDGNNDDGLEDLRDLKNGYQSLKDSKWGRKFRNSKFGKWMSKTKGRLGKSRLGKGFSKIKGSKLGKGIASNAGKIFDVGTSLASGDPMDLLETGQDLMENVDTNKLKGKARSGVNKVKGKFSGVRGKVTSKLPTRVPTSTGTVTKAVGKTGKLGKLAGKGGKALGKAGKMLGKAGKVLGKVGLRGAIKAAGAFAGPIGWGVSLLASGPEILKTITNPIESLKHPLDTLGSFFGLTDHPAEKKEKKEKAKAALARGEENPVDENGDPLLDEDELKELRQEMGVNGGGEQAQQTDSGILSIAKSVATSPLTAMAIGGKLLGGIFSGGGSILGGLFGGIKSLFSGAGKVGAGIVTGMGSVLGKGASAAKSAFNLLNPLNLAKNMLMMSPLGLFIGMGRKWTNEAMASEPMKLAERDPKKLSQLLFANTPVGSLYNLAEPSNLALSPLSRGLLEVFTELDEEGEESADPMRDTLDFNGEKGNTTTIKDNKGTSGGSSGSGEGESSSGGSSSGSSSSGGSTATASSSGLIASNTSPVPSSYSSGGTATASPVSSRSNAPSGGSTTPSYNRPQTSSSAYSPKTNQPVAPKPRHKIIEGIKDEVRAKIDQIDTVAKKLSEVRSKYEETTKKRIAEGVDKFTKELKKQSEASGGNPLDGWEHERYLVLRDILDVVENIGEDVVGIGTKFDEITKKLKEKTVKITKNNTIRKTINVTIEEGIKKAKMAI